ncbi:hypothetical protein BFL35_00950 [Clavibacter michiganensis]|nr:hypothetical protein BFL35_00950 [Clavibacter michiganensis]
MQTRTNAILSRRRPPLRLSFALAGELIGITFVTEERFS